MDHHPTHSSDLPTSNKHLLFLSLMLIIFGIVIPLIWLELFSSTDDAKRQHVDLPQPATSNAYFAAPEPQWQIIRVQAGDSLARIFSRAGFSPRELLAVLKAAPSKKTLTQLKPQQKLYFLSNEQNQLQELLMPLSLEKSLDFFREGQQFQTRTITHEIDRHPRQVSGTIQNSLFVAAANAGLPQRLIMQLTQIFGWDIDFSQDIQPGDTFSVLYEELYRDGKNFKTGNIIAAEFSTQKHKYRAVRYTAPNGVTDYYDQDGRSMRKAFLRAPLKFSRISSRFTYSRKHPILHRIRAHKGVDYAAPRNTPIKSTGNGKIIFRGRKGGYGNAIIIQHGRRYTTLYAHMQKFAKGFKRGSRVKQGQVIGYVGSSGLATGPHCHYEFRINGKHRNPLTIKLPKAQPIAKQFRDDFKAKSQLVFAKLKLLRSANVA